MTVSIRDIIGPAGGCFYVQSIASDATVELLPIKRHLGT